MNLTQVFPMFVAGFILLALIRSLGDYFIVQKGFLWNLDSWNSFGGFIQTWSGYFIVVAMAGAGLGTDVRSFRQLGVRPFLVGLFAAFTVGLVSFALTKLFIPV